MTTTPPASLNLDEIEGRAAALYEYATLDDEPLQADANQLTGEDVPALLAEVRRLRAQLATAEADTLGEVATELEEIDFHPNAKSSSSDLCRMLAGRFRRKALRVLDEVRAHGGADTLPAWLYSRFNDRLDAPAWDQLADDDRTYWEHQARAVRRAVARGGFKVPA